MGSGNGNLGEAQYEPPQVRLVLMVCVEEVTRKEKQNWERRTHVSWWKNMRLLRSFVQVSRQALAFSRSERF